MRNALLVDLVLLAVAFVYFFIMRALSFGKSHPHSKRVVSVLTANITVCSFSTAYNFILMLTKKVFSDGGELAFGVHFLKTILFKPTVMSIDVIILNVGVLFVNAATFAVATKIIPLHNDYKNLAFEKKVVSGYVVNCSIFCLGVIAVLLTAFI